MYKLFVIHNGRVIHEEKIRRTFKDAVCYVEEYCLKEADSTVWKATQDNGPEKSYIIAARWERCDELTYYILTSIED